VGLGELGVELVEKCTGIGGVCLPTCSDNQKNNAESDVDCGGGDCSLCHGGQQCGVVDAYCISGDCTPDGTCAKDPNGTPCGGDAQCVSGDCVDGVCCSGTCTGLCRRCDLPGSAGTCSDIGSGDDPDDECTDPETCNGSGNCQE
jgi:hypothetical protein